MATALPAMAPTVMEPTKAFSTISGAPTTLSELLEPFSLQDFFKNFGENFIHIPGPAGKFSGLFPWDILNMVLRQHRLIYPRLRVFRDGKLVPVDQYSKVSVGRKQRSTAPRLMPGDLIGQLQSGSTLVVDAVDELYEPLTTLAESLESDLREHIQVNLYAGWHSSPGFDVHWDDHDVIVLQLAGRKEWAIHGDTRKYPLANDIVKDKTPPEKPVWRETISDGDLLYIPRGFWHVARPLDEPSLHLTIGIPNRTGIDLITWLAQRLRTHAELRKDLPKFKCSEEKKSHYANLFDIVKGQLNDDLIEAFLAKCDASATPRVRLNLPQIASTGLMNELMDRRFVLSTPRPLRIIDEGSLLLVACLKKEFRFKKSALSLLRLLNERNPVTVDDLTNASDGTLNVKTVSEFLKELLTHGIISAVNEN